MKKALESFAQKYLHQHSNKMILPFDPPTSKILMVKTHAIGDVLMITPTIHAARTLFPEAQITFLTGEWSAPVVKDNPSLSSLITFPDALLHKHKFFGITKLIRKIRKESFDLALIFHPSSAIHLLVMAMGIKHRVGFSYQGSGFSLSHAVEWAPNGDRYIGEYFFDLIRAVGYSGEKPGMELFIPEWAEQEANSLIEKIRISSSPLIILCPGGGKNPRDHVPAKVWSALNYGTIARYLINQYNATILLLGSADDSPILQKVAELLKPSPSHALPGVALMTLAALIKKANLLITNDSAPLHIGVATGTKTVGIFGPTNPKALLPPVSGVWESHAALECSPCYSNSVFPGCADPRCIESVTPDRVIPIVDQAMAAIA